MKRRNLWGEFTTNSRRHSSFRFLLGKHILSYIFELCRKVLKPSCEDDWGSLISSNDHWNNWRIIYVVEGGQMYRLGMRVGWKIIAVNDEKLNASNVHELQQIIEQDSMEEAITLTFDVIAFFFFCFLFYCSRRNKNFYF